MTEADAFDIGDYTGAALRMDARIEFDGKSAAEVFEIMGDPEQITDWYLLAKAVKMHPPVENEEKTFKIEFS